MLTEGRVLLTVCYVNLNRRFMLIDETIFYAYDIKEIWIASDAGYQLAFLST